MCKVLYCKMFYLNDFENNQGITNYSYINDINSVCNRKLSSRNNEHL